MLFILIILIISAAAAQQICQSKDECTTYVLSGEETRLKVRISSDGEPDWKLLHTMTLEYPENPSAAE